MANSTCSLTANLLPFIYVCARDHAYKNSFIVLKMHKLRLITYCKKTHAVYL